MKINKLMIAAPSSGTGKTTVALALLAALKEKGLSIRPFKTGPDYIDTAYHEQITGNLSYNLDSYFLDRASLRSFFCDKSKGFDISIVEGAMGFYDGISNSTDASSFDVSIKLGIPVILVIDPKGMGISAAALIKGFMDFRRNNDIKGVILNKIKPDLYEYYKNIIESNTGLCVCGYLPEMESVAIPSGRLGLRTANDIKNFNKIASILGQVASETFDFRNIAKIAAGGTEITARNLKKSPKLRRYNLAVAKDGAFCFRYNENIELLEEEGADVTYFSPLYDSSIPQGTQALYLCGGFPENYLDRLSQNTSMLKSIREFAQNGGKIYAECGGFMYLHKAIKNTGGKEYKMVGIIDAVCEMTDKLQPFGYVEFEALENNILCKKGEKIYGHEFHYSKSAAVCNAFNAVKSNGKTWISGVADKNILAGYAHIYFPSTPEIVKNFSKAARK